jgi:hypothetical protein
MKIERITIRLGETINQGNFNNAKYEIEASAVIEPGEDTVAALDKLEDEVRARCAIIRRTLVKE